ncbi:nucleotide disphospho-sugar-binding domain-containing protein [Crossiella cryophila]|uniref:UDP:flavonoid glycosyltransferase YjiC (YdhE family) n=1 Tax=Crossiella cryophila TaxID=43355 RepID=A0A7W7FRF0_9PSEU|nr:nucleotide disphospho-sugar-binding domain-containing protein [Crossiella cryophila]MBB4675921.1 UDP:flavonoid glycosyltransferase YjiC (YdhE family) [Crossiella cryophila]
MRVLVVSSMGLGHLFPMVPTMWALRAAGHEVLLLSTAAGAAAGARAGLPVVEAAPGVDWEAELTPPPGEVDLLTRVASRFARMADLMSDGAVRQAAHWRPDLIVYELIDATGPLLAAKFGIPCVHHGFGITSVGPLFDRIRDFLGAALDRHGVADLATPATTIDIAPPSLGGDLGGLRTRYVPYNGGAVLPDWLAAPRERPRIVVTMGTVLTHLDDEPWRSILTAAKDTEAELLLAAGSIDLSGLGELPPHTRVLEYLPLSALLPVSDALVHHGGSGSTLTALACGVPQLVLPQGADQFYNGQRIAARGVGLTAEHEGVSAGQIHRLLHDADIGTAVTEVLAELAAMPSPAELVPALAAIAQT